ncbi:MAG: RNA polymerase B [Phylliscum demangeonii]|nr:MAG: RNA polymerase B [Phylliscum demangeonii]
MATSAPMARVREQPMGEEEADTEIHLGDFQHVPALTLSEARLVINVVQRGRESKNLRPVKDSEALKKTVEYLEVFSRMKQKENIEATERLLSSQEELEPYERSQLGSLCCETAEEAKTLIPSLVNKKTDADLQELLDEITKMRTFIV